MIKQAMEYLMALKTPKTFEIGGRTYSSEKLSLIERATDRPAPIGATSLESAVKLISRENKYFASPTFVRAESERKISVFSTFNIDDEYRRYTYYNIECDAPKFAPGWYDREDMTIKLMSIFEQNQGSEYILDTISRISVNNVIETSDNGITQTVVMRQGAEIKAKTQITPIVRLKPYRTFLEVDQPESKFLFRVGEKTRIGLLEADGGMWKLEAKRNIVDYLEANLSDLTQSGNIVVTA
jgi:hypothetical protein